MTGLLLKKQLFEIFKSYFYDAKKNRARSKFTITAYFIFFVVFMVVVWGGLFALLSSSICKPLHEAGVSWLYYILMGVMAITLGAFGSVFNTFSALYLAKDNDLIFSLPIPVNSIMISRLLTVYLMGLMYSAGVIAPAILVDWISTGLTGAKFLGGLFLVLNISLIDFVISCLLGYVITRVSLKLKNKGILTALIAVFCIGAYYFFYFRFSDMLKVLVQNAGRYGARIKGSAWILYLFGTMGVGNITSICMFTIGTVIVVLLTWVILQRSFLKIATSTGTVTKTVYREKTVSEKSLSEALLCKELKKFTSSASYMLNCGLGILILPIAGIALLWKGAELMNSLSQLLGTNGVIMLLCSVLCMAGVMIDTAAPSVSLEGKNLWIAQSLPINPWHVIRSKLFTELLLGEMPMLFAALCGAFVIVREFLPSPGTVILFMLLPLLFKLLMACWGLFLGVQKANTNWTSEIHILKQSMPVNVSLFSGWGFVMIMCGLFLWQRDHIDLPLYMALFSLLVSLLSVMALRWLKERGARKFAEL